jgi:predicted outer membrane repeat protein
MRGKANYIRLLLGMLLVLAAKQTVVAHNPPPEPSGPPKTIYVDAEAVGANDGSSWNDAFNYLRDALTMASAGDEIRVAQGIYKPDQGLKQNVGDHRASFELVNEVAIKGGYAGFGEPDPNARNVELYETILSGDLQGNDVDVNNPRDLLDEPTRDENSYHILTSSGNGSDTTLDGFVITGGKGTGLLVTHSELTIINCTFMRNSVRHNGGAIYVENSQPLLVNCKFIDNLAMDFGGAIYSDGSNLTLSECSFIGNCADSGGGMSSFGDGDAVLTSCIFQNNLAWHSSGALSHNGGRLELNDCSFSSNIAFFWSSGVSIGGGAVGTGISEEVVITNCLFNSHSSRLGGALYGNVELLENCVFTGNTAEYGGALYQIESATIKNCIFTGNMAINGAVLVGGGSVNLESCTFTGNLAQTVFASLRARDGTPGLEMTVENSILWDGDNEFEEFNISINHSNIQGDRSGEGNIDLDPCFAEPGYWDPNGTADDPNDDFWIDGDYHLKSQTGRWDPNSQSWVQDDVTSHCIDAGDPNTPIGHEPFPNGGRINIGAYGGTAEASISLSGIHAKYGGGTGEPNDPYLIYTAEHLNTIGIDTKDCDKHFKLMADIDLDPNLPGCKVFDEAVIGYFKGVFDGNGHTISNFSYTTSNGLYIGLFRQISGQNAQIKDLGLIAPDIDAGAGSHVGSLVGQVSSGTITNCYVEGGNVLGEELVGGLVGLNHGNLNDCYSTCSVTGKDDVGGLVGLNNSTTITNCFTGGEVLGRENVGGLAGSNSGTIKNSSATGSVTVEKRSIVTRENRNIGGLIGRNSGPLISCSAAGDVSGDVYVGGLVGNNSDSIINCYATGDVLGTDYIGGLVGNKNSISIINCYATGGVSGTTYVGGLVGYKGVEATVLNSFWDIQTSGQLISGGGMGKTTVEMQTAGTFFDAGWDFAGETENGTEDIWWIFEGQDYPRLWWEPTENDLLSSGNMLRLCMP